MADEFELIDHPEIAFVKAFLVQTNYRTPHLHNDFECCAVLAGMAHVLTKGMNLLCGNGTVLLFNPNQPHEIRASEGGALFLSLQVSYRFCESYFPQLRDMEFDFHRPCPEPGESGERMLRALLFEIARCYFQKGTGYELALFGLLNFFSIPCCMSSPAASVVRRGGCRT